MSELMACSHIFVFGWLAGFLVGMIVTGAMTKEKNA